MQIVEYASLAVTLLISAVAVIHWRRHLIRPWHRMGFIIDEHTGRDMLAATLTAVLAVALIFLIDWSFHLVEIVRIAGPTVEFSLFMLFLIIAAFTEEFISRSLMVNGLLLLLKRTWLIVLVVSILFGLNHAAGEGVTAISILSNALGGATYTLAFLGSKNIWFPWVLHFWWNASQSLFGYPVSGILENPLVLQDRPGDPLWTGGSYGPEGGLVGLAVRLLVIGAILCYLRRTRKVTLRELFS